MSSTNLPHPRIRETNFPILLSTNVLSSSDEIDSDNGKMSFSDDDELSYDADEFLQLLNETVPSATPVIGFKIFHGMNRTEFTNKLYFLINDRMSQCSKANI